MSYLVLAMEESPRYEDAPVVTPYRISTVNHFLPIISGRVAGTPAYRDRDDELRGNLSPMPSIVESIGAAGQITVGGYMTSGIVLSHLAGLVMTGVAGDGTNEVQSLTQSGTISGGTWTLTLTSTGGGTAVVTGIPYNTTAAGLQALVDARIRRGGTGFQIGDVVIGGGAFPGTPLTITYQGTHAAKDVTAATKDTTGLTGSTPGITVATPTPGAIGTVLLPDGSGTPTGAYRWQSTKLAGATAKTAQVIACYTESAAFEKGQGFGVSKLAMGNDGNFQADMIGLVALGADDPSLSPSYDTPAVMPMLDRDLLVTWQSGSGNISELTWQLDNPIQATRNYGIRSTYMGQMRYDAGWPTLTGGVSMDSYDPDDRDSFLAASTFASRGHWRTRSKVGSSGALYQFFVEAPSCQLVGGTGQEDLAAKRRHAASYNWKAGYDSVAGYDFRFTFVAALVASTGIEVYV